MYLGAASTLAHRVGWIAMSSRGVVSAVGPSLSISRVETASEVREARELHARVYLERRYVKADEVDRGVLATRVDPWAESATYFLARSPTGRAVAVGRQIYSDDPAALPALRLPGLDDGVVSQVQRQGGSRVVEISALAVRATAPRDTAIQLYSHMWLHSIECEHTAWIMAIHPALARSIVGLLGPVIVPMGPPQWFMGSDVIPAVIWTDQAAQIIHCTAAQSRDLPMRSRLPTLFPANDAVRRP